jgi:hypothetical protein
VFCRFTFSVISVADGDKDSCELMRTSLKYQALDTSPRG